MCPFCRVDLQQPIAPTTEGAPADESGDGFDALAAAAEVSESELLPSPNAMDDEPDDAPEHGDAPLTEGDLAHLTGLSGPDFADWQQTPPPPPPIDSNDDDDTVSKVMVIPLIAAAVVAVVFVAYSIVTQDRPERPDTVALIDRSTTTAALTTTTTEPEAPLDGAVAIGDDIAEQAARLCRGDQFSIARAGELSTATYNDVMVAVQDGRSDWVASSDQEMVLGPVPPLVGCLETADAGEIDRCPNVASTISRRAVSWRYRLLSTADGTELASDAGEAREVRPCEKLEILADGSDYGSWSALPQDRFDAVAPAYTEAPHPQEACHALLRQPPATAVADPPNAGAAPEPEIQPTGPGLAVHATGYRTPAIDLTLPDGWAATAERPVEAVLCFIATEDLPLVAEAVGAGDDAAVESDVVESGAVESDAVEADPAEPIIAVPPAEEPVAECSVTIAAMTRSSEFIGSWHYVAPDCSPSAEISVPNDWLIEQVGPALGYPLDVPDESEGASAEGE